jgi:hypothetical protein
LSYAALGLCCQSALAAYSPTDPVYVFADAGLRFDDNVLLLNPGQSVPAGYGTGQRGDWIRSASAGLHAETGWSRQHLSLDSQYAQNEYAHYHSVSYNSWQNTLDWDWALGDRLTGAVTAQDHDDLSGAGYVAGGQNDLTRNRTISSSVAWAYANGLTFDGSALRTVERHSLMQDYDFDQNSASSGATWTTGRGSSLGLHVDNRQVQYLQDQSQAGYSDAYSLHYVRLDGVWPLTGKTRFSGRIGKVRLATSARTTPSQSIGSLDVLWSMSGKTVLDLGWARDYDDPGRSVVPTVSDTESLKLTNQFSSKTSWSAELRRESRDYTSTAVGRENTTSLRLAMAWHPSTSVEVSPFVDQVLRSSDSVTDAYRDRQIGTTVKLYF